MGTFIAQMQSSLDDKTEKPAEEEPEFFMNPSLMQNVKDFLTDPMQGSSEEK